MSDYPAPREILPIFNESDFTHKNDNITHSEGDGKYLRITGGDISGDLEISGTLEISDGLNTAPSLTFFNEPNTGIYRSGIHKLNFSVLGNEVAHFTTDETLIKTAQLDLQNGTETLPALSFEDDQDTGIYRVSSNVLGVSAGNKKVMEIANSTIDFDTGELEIKDGANVLCRVNANGQILGNDHFGLGSADPSFAFTDDENTGMFRVSDNILGFSTNGFSRLELSFNTANFANDIEIANTQELRTDRITTTTATPLVLDSTNGYTLNGDVSNSGQAHFLARKTIDQSIPVLTLTDIDFDADISSSVITRLVPSFSEFSLNTTGVFLITSEVWLENASTTYEAYFRHSSSANLRYGFTRLTSSNSDIKFTLTAIINNNDPGATLKLSVSHGAGVPLNFRASSQFRHAELSIVKLL